MGRLRSPPESPRKFEAGQGLPEAERGYGA